MSEIHIQYPSPQERAERILMLFLEKLEKLDYEERRIIRAYLQNNLSPPQVAQIFDPHAFDWSKLQKEVGNE